MEFWLLALIPELPLTTLIAMNMEEPSRKCTERCYYSLVLLCYVVVLSILTATHEVWRDEVRAYSIVAGADSFFDVFAALQNEGHPALWYVILYLLHQVFQSSWVLQFASFCTAVGAALLVLSYAPFTRIQKTLFVFGFYPIYEYAVYARNYGIGMLLLFLFCVLKERKPESLWLRILVIAVLAHTSFFATLLSFGLVLCEAVEEVWLKGSNERGKYRLPTAVLFAFSSIALALYTMYPDARTEVTSLPQLSILEVPSILFSGLLSHGAFAHNAFVSPFALLIPLLLLTLYGLFWPYLPAIVFLLCSVWGIEAAHRIVYSAAALRHQGFLFLAVIAAIWMRMSSDRRTPAVHTLRQTALSTLLTLLLVLQVYHAIKAGWHEVQTKRSSAADFAQWLSASQYSTAIILGEPYYVLETLPYYISNELFFPRENRYGRVVAFTKDSRKTIGVQDMLNSAQQLKKEHEYKREILLLLPPQVHFAMKTPVPREQELRMMYDRVFTYTASELAALKAQAEFLTLFNDALGDENFAVYRYLPPKEQ